MGFSQLAPLSVLGFGISGGLQGRCGEDGGAEVAPRMPQNFRRPWPIQSTFLRQLLLGPDPQHSATQMAFTASMIWLARSCLDLQYDDLASAGDISAGRGFLHRHRSRADGRVTVQRTIDL